MSDLYGKNLAWVYDEIYQGFIDYKAEYEFYKAICKRYNSFKILEIACGTGNLAKSFSTDFDSYIGLDYSAAMLQIAKQKFPAGQFIQGDMRKLNFTHQFNAVLITGRSTSYLVNKADLDKTFESVYKTLESNGIFVFDTINANMFMPYIQQNEIVVHTSNYNGKVYERISRWKREKSDSYHLINWQSEYFKIEGPKKFTLGKDSSIFRAFSQEEIGKSLIIAGFNILETLERKTYAFETQVFICKKK